MPTYEAYAWIKVEGKWDANYKEQDNTPKKAWRHLLVKLLDLKLEHAQEIKAAIRELPPEETPMGSRT